MTATTFLCPRCGSIKSKRRSYPGGMARIDYYCGASALYDGVDSPYPDPDRECQREPAIRVKP